MDKVRALIAAGANVNAKSNRGKTALMNAAEKDGADSVRALIAAGADVNAKNDEGKTALIFAQNRPDIIRALKTPGLWAWLARSWKK